MFGEIFISMESWENVSSKQFLLLITESDFFSGSLLARKSSIIIIFFSVSINIIFYEECALMPRII